MLDQLTRRLATTFAKMRGKGRISEDDVNEMLREVRVALLEADVNFQVAKELIAKVKEKAIGEEVFGSLNADQTIIKIVRDELTEVMGGSESNFNWASSPPTVILMCGLQGSGKTTTSAKLCQYLKRQGKKPMMVACDTQRPAAITQLQVLGEQVDVPVFALTDGTKPPEIARQALERCKYLQNDVLIVDTAGRLSIDEDLMNELEQVRKVVGPHETFLVLDGSIGQEAVNIAKAFDEKFKLTGTIFTKLDGDTRGGAILSVKQVTGVPVRFIGIGERTDALEVFYPDRLAQRILGFGDVLGLIEQAEFAIDKDDAADLQQKMMSGGMDFDMMLGQFRMMRKMGPIQGLLKKLPGIAGALPEGALDQINDGHMDRVEAIILSMTPQERKNPDIMNGSRRKRISQGSGVPVQEVNQLVTQLYEMRKMMKQAKKMEKRHKKFNKRR